MTLSDAFMLCSAVALRYVRSLTQTAKMGNYGVFFFHGKQNHN